MTNQKNVAEQTNINSQRETIKVNVTIDVDRTKYEQFRRIFDAQSESEFVSWALDNLWDEVTGRNPDVLADFLTAQNKRLAKQEA